MQKIRSDALERFWKYLLLSLPYFLIYSILLSNIVLLSLLAVSIIIFFSKKDYSKVEVADYFFPIAIFFIGIVGLSYTSSFTAGLSILETRIPLLIVPITLAFANQDFSIRAEFLKHFLYSLLLTMAVTLTVAIYRNIKGPGLDMWFNKWYYHYSDLTEPINIDPLYLALFVGFGILIILSEELNLTRYRLIKNRSMAIIILILLGGYLTIIGVRSIIIIILLLSLLSVFFKRRSVSKKRIILVTLIIFGMAGLSYISPVTRARFQGLINSKFEFSEYSVDRFVIWSVAFREIKTNPSYYVLGGGIGSSEMLMEELYEREKIEWDFKQKTNTHNQYIEFILDVGFCGVFALLSFLFVSLVIFKNAQDRLGVIFIILMMLAMVSENYLNRQKGVVFFSIFYSLFYFTRDNINSKKVPRFPN